MDWTTLTLIVPIARWAKKQFDIGAREKRASEREKAVAKREAELNELIEVRDFNTKQISDLVFLEAERVDYRLGGISNIASIYILITNRSIFDITLHKFIVRPKFESQELSDISQVEERKIVKQSATGFEIRYDLQQTTSELIMQQTTRKEKGHWQFEMQGYFHSKVGDFDRVQTSSLNM